MMRYAFAAIFAISFASPAFAICDQAPEFLACYHPTASFTGCKQTSPDRAFIYFRGGVTNRPYQLEVAVEKLNGFGRVILLGDNATLPPNSRCTLQEWRPLVR